MNKACVPVDLLLDPTLTASRQASARIGRSHSEVGICLPVRDLRDSTPIVPYLKRISSGYRQAARRGQALAAREAPTACC